MYKIPVQNIIMAKFSDFNLSIKFECFEFEIRFVIMVFEKNCDKVLFLNI